MPDERKLVTILFADTVGSTSLGESLDPEDLRALMRRYYEHARRIVSGYGGTVEKFIGDAVMAVFGLPQAHSNDAERALAAALALHAAVAADSVLGGRLQLRIGVNTGNVITATDSDRGDFLVTGDAVNVAARLEQVASPGEILVSKRTAAATEASFLFAEGRSVMVKGKAQPLHAFPLTEQRPVQRQTRSPLVGRKPDLAQLTLLCDRALAERRPQLVSLVAPAGTGKTRLLDEFLARLDPQDGFRVATARCLPYGQTLTYWPLRGLLEDLLGSSFTPGHVAEAFVSGGQSADDAERLAELVLALLGVESEDTSPREAIFNAWRLLLEVLAAAAPRIVVFEDLHWASESLLDLVEYLMRPRTQAPLMIVATSRPELLDRRPGWGGGRRNFTALTLEPLSGAQTRILVQKITKRLPQATREQIVERSGGNPFFVIELARGYSERQLASVAGMDGEALPDTVQEALQERLDLLSERERSVLQAASVAGRQFRTATLKAVCTAAEPAEIDLALDGLLARDLITSVAGSNYAFRHLLIRDVAYGTLSRAERIRLHTAVADWLEDFAAGRLDEFVELIAYHLREAVVLARQVTVVLDTSIDTARAVRFLERAGEVASRSGAYVEAGDYLYHAIELAPEADHLRLYEMLGDYLIVGDASLSAYRHALEVWRSTLSHEPLVGARLMRKLLTVLMRWWGTLSERMSREEMVKLRGETRQLVEATGDEYETWRLNTVELFWSHWSRESALEGAPVQMEEGLTAAAYFEERGDWAAFSEALDAYASCAADQGMYEEACAACRRRMSVSGLSPNERYDALAMLVWRQTEAGKFATALETMKSAIAGRKSSEPVGLLEHAASWASFAAYLSGCWSDFAKLASLVDASPATSSPDLVGQGVLPQGYYVSALQMAIAQENQPEAERLAATLQRMIRADSGSEWLQTWIEATLHDDSSLLRDLTRSISGEGENWPERSIHPIMFLSERGIPVPRDLLDRFAAHPRARYVDYLQRTIEIGEALAAQDDQRLAAAIQNAEAHGLAPHAARMRIVLAQRTGNSTHLAQARPVLERLGDRQFLRRLDEVAAALH